MLKQGLISIADIQDISDVEDSSESSETDSIDESDEDILKQAKSDPAIKSALKQAMLEKLAVQKKAAKTKNAKKLKGGARVDEDEIEYGSDG